MSVRLVAHFVTVAVVAMLPSAVRAQAPWIPPKGEATVSVSYQWVDSDRHLFSDLTGPKLTPLEIVRGTDYQTNSLDFGRVQSHALVVGGDVGVTNRFALSGTLAVIAPRYRGAFGHPGIGDNGAFHPSVQDLQIGARYMLSHDVWALTPFTVLTTPVADYEVLAHAAQGLGLQMLEVGASVGRILLVGGASKGYLQGSYGYAFTESAVPGISLNRSRAVLEAGAFFGRFAVQGLTSWRRVHGGLEWSDVGFGSHEHFAGHDQAAATREWRFGAGVSLQLTQGTSIDVSYGELLRGANTHDGRVIALGWTWGFKAFGGPTLGGGFK
jgi:hypothetical protein